MFLNELNRDESLAFINLVTELALANDVLEKEQEELMESFCDEMGLGTEDIKEMNYETALEIIKKSSKRIINIMYFEMIRVGLVDGECEFEEIEFLEKVEDELNISRAERIKFANYFYNFPEITPENEEEAREVAKVLL
ncbi:hypothetical protein SAMN02745163_00611 [Clostridium cavendishii DSM 21758]|uniref:Tellurite resistance protein TerB n=1 Tax=Clostridium cavendishii DSM 21758 TaxID=1121302 RepID=A0A1M6D1U5_9CLOT|nr:hypothetical protein [Clostridium cavendishii]SHI67169.1 hypothetical protein SAMN02745163_00611 [Clostridium cavendishii DSM 21758]